MNARPATFRFAPSPNGDLHLGHAFAAVYAARAADRVHGRFLVRIEDIDAARCRSEFVGRILDDLAWLGLGWETPVLCQSGRFAAYAQAASQLESMGLIYPCFASRSEIAAALPDDPVRDPEGSPLYPGLYRHADAAEVEARKRKGEPFALRLDTEKAIALAGAQNGTLTFQERAETGATEIIEARPELWGDAIIVRKDTPASYHLAVVVDDAYQGVTHVTRGRDLYEATWLQRLLQALLRLPEPIYQHHRLILDPKGRKLSKSAGDTSLSALRHQGATRDDILRLLEPTDDLPQKT